MPLEAQLIEALTQLTELTLAERDPERAAELRELQRQLAGELRGLVRRAVQADTAAYREASEALQAASASLAGALKDLDQVEDVLEKLTRAARLLGKLAARLV